MICEVQWSVGIEPLTIRYVITKLDLVFTSLSIICVDIDLSIQTHITCIVYYLSALRVAHKIYNLFMNLNNPVETVVYYLLIGGMTYFDCWNEVVMIHQTTILHELSMLREYWVCVEINMRLWLMSETLMWSYIPIDGVIYPYKLIKSSDNRYSQ